MRQIDVQTDGSPIEVRVFDGDQQVARHVIRGIGGGHLVFCSGGQDEGDKPPAKTPEGDGWLPDVDLTRD